MSDSLISVIIPCYNAEQHIAETVSSVLSQTYHHIEIIAVDDGSTDATGTVLDGLAKQFEQIQVLHKQNGGVTNARLSGIAKARGEYIAFVDADDRIDPDMYERLLCNIKRFDADISHCGYRVIRKDETCFYNNSGVLFVQDQQKGIADLLEGKMIEPSLCNKLFHCSLAAQLLASGKMDCSIKNNEDLLMNYYLFSLADRSVFEDFCPYQYIAHEESASKGIMNVHKLFDPVIVARTIFEDLKNDGSLVSVSLGLYLIKLIRAATYYGRFADDDISVARKSAQKELRRMMTDVLKDRQLPMKNKLLSLFAACDPHLYWIVHQVFLKFV